MPNHLFDPGKAGWTIVDFGGFVEYFGPLWRRNADDGVRYGLKVESKHLNRSGFVHGGVLAALLDTALGITSWEAIAERKQATVSLDVQYLAPVPDGAFIIAEPVVVKTTRSLSFMRGTLSVDGEICAIAQGTWKILRS